MHAEAAESSAAVVRLLERNSAAMDRVSTRLRSIPPSSVVTIARGSSDNACTYGRYLIENRMGIVCASAGPSVGSIYDAPALPGSSLCIAISQSGASPDLLAAVERKREAGAFVVGLINQEGSPLAALCDEVITLEAAPECSVAATKSFIASLAALTWLVAEWTRDDELLEAVHGLPTLLDEAWQQDWSSLVATLAHASNLFAIGRGPGLGVAQEAALKLKETCGIHAEAISAAEVLHGPMALVQDGFPVLALVQRDESRTTTIEVAERLASMGGDVLIAGSGALGCSELPSVIAHPAIEPILAIQSFYKAAADLSVTRGFNPDSPPNLAKVTRSM